MFDPLSGALASLIVEGLSALSDFLQSKGIPFDVSGWAAFFAAAVAGALIAFGNLFGAQLPADFQGWIPYIVKFVLTLLEMFGIKMVILTPLGATWRAKYASLKAAAAK